MTKEDRLSICRTCTNRKLDFSKGLLCSLTEKIACFETICEMYILDVEAKEKEDAKKANELVNKRAHKKILLLAYLVTGTILFASILPCILTSSCSVSDIILATIRLGFNSLLFYLLIKGSNSARVFLSILLAINIFIGYLRIRIYFDTHPIILLNIPNELIYIFTFVFIWINKDIRSYFNYINYK